MLEGQTPTNKSIGYSEEIAYCWRKILSSVLNVRKRRNEGIKLPVKDKRSNVLSFFEQTKSI